LRQGIWMMSFMGFPSGAARPRVMQWPDVSVVLL